MSKHVIAQAHDRIGSTKPVCRQTVAVLASHVIASTKCAAIHMLMFFLLAFAVVGCDDSSSATAGPNDEPGIESSSSVEQGSSSSENAKYSSSKEEKNAKESSDSVKSESSSSKDPELADGSPSSSSAGKVNCSALLEESMSFWDVPKECRFNPDIDYGTMTDERDGKVYRTVKIGNQTWMAENLNFDPGQGGSGEGKYDWSWCYNDKPKNCEVAGRLYTWAAAMDSVGMWSTNGKGCGFWGETCSSIYPVRGICPEDWHLPTQAEWNALFTAVGGRLTAGDFLKSQSGWSRINGSDAFGFSALPAGVRYYDGIFDFGSYYAFFWSATESNGNDAYHTQLYYNNFDAYHLNDTDKCVGHSVRCVKD